jgi:hypothetical protein
MHAHTWFCQRHEIRHILHENATFELQLRFAALIHQWFGGELVFRFAEVDVLAAKQDRLEEVDVVLREWSVNCCYFNPNSNRILVVQRPCH